MKAVCWYGKKDVRVENVTDPKILNGRDAIVKITLTAICGSDLHLYNGCIPTMEEGDILGHEFMGEVVEVGKEITNLKKGDRVVVPFDIACGRCFFCQRNLFSLCDNSNPNAALAEAAYGSTSAGLFGYSHLYGGYAGGQAQYARVPFADVGPLKIEDGLRDDQVLFLSDIFPTGYMAAENCNIHAGDTVAVWGCGPVGLFAFGFHISVLHYLGLTASGRHFASFHERLEAMQIFGDLLGGLLAKKFGYGCAHQAAGRIILQFNGNLGSAAARRIAKMHRAGVLHTRPLE